MRPVEVVVGVALITGAVGAAVLWARFAGRVRRAGGVGVAGGRPGGSDWRGKRCQARERVGELLGPWPCDGESEGGRSRMEGESSGDVQKPVAQAFGFGGGEFAAEQQSLGPGDQVVRDTDDRQPHVVVVKVAEREVAQAGVLVVADVVLDASAAAVIALELSDGAGLVGEDRLEAMPVVIGERQLRAGMRALASDDHPRAVGPAGQVQVLGELTDLPVGAGRDRLDRASRPSSAGGSGGSLSGRSRSGHSQPRTRFAHRGTSPKARDWRRRCQRAA